MKKLLIVECEKDDEVKYVGCSSKKRGLIHPKFKEVTLPSDEEIEKMVDEIAKESTAADKDTPNWMKADIRNGINAIINEILNQ